MNPYHHSLSSVSRYGGKAEDYLPIHDWFDLSKRSWCDPRHRALRHHAEGIDDCISKFNYTILNSDNRTIPVRYIGEDHVREDLGFIPTMVQWYEKIEMQKWMIMTMQIPSATNELLLNNIPTKLRKSR